MGKDLFGKELGRGFSQRKDGRYEARAMINGVKIDIYAQTLSKLRKLFDEEKAKVLRNEKNLRPKITLSEWFEEWFETCKTPQLKGEANAKCYKRKIKNTYIAILGDKQVEYISQINIQDATNQLLNLEYSPRLIKEACSVLSQVFEGAILNKIITINPCKNITVKNSIIRKERRVLSSEEQRILLSELENDYYYELYAFLLCTGLRIGELGALQWSDIDFRKKCININKSLQTAYIDSKKYERISTPKTFNSYRTVPFFNNTGELLEAWRKKQDICKKETGSKWRCPKEYGDLVFTTTLGSPITRYVLAGHMKKVVEKINFKEYQTAFAENRAPQLFEHIHPHSLRHTFATRCFEKELDPLFIQRIMGHSDYTTTMSYTHILEKVKEREVDKAGDMLVV